MAKKARALLRDIINYPFVVDVVKALNISKSTLYDHIKPDEIARLRAEGEKMLES